MSSQLLIEFNSFRGGDFCAAYLRPNALADLPLAPLVSEEGWIEKGQLRLAPQCNNVVAMSMHQCTCSAVFSKL